MDEEHSYSINYAEHPVLGIGAHLTATVEDSSGNIFHEIKTALE
jgi:hypothetical protein